MVGKFEFKIFVQLDFLKDDFILVVDLVQVDGMCVFFMIQVIGLQFV